MELATGYCGPESLEEKNMASQTVTGQEKEASVVRPQTGLFAGRRGRALRETLTAYLFLAPALFIIFTFGIFPIFYAAYVSLYKWRIRQGEFRGLDNFVTAMGDVAYIFFGLIVLLMLGIAVRTILQAREKAREKQIPYQFPLMALIPGAFISYGLLQILLRFITFFSQQEAIEAGYAQILGSIPFGIALIAIGGGLSYLLGRWQHNVAAKSQYSILPGFTGPATTLVITLGVAFVLGRFTYLELQASERYGRALFNIGFMILGMLILGVAYLIWNWAMKQHSTKKTVVGLLGAVSFIGAGVYYSVFWPIISRQADPDFYLSLKVTVFYSLGTVPVQLTIALILAYLLYQNIKGKGLFRVIFFIPYIAPAVATAGIFQVLFSLREQSIANQIVNILTAGQVSTLNWLQEPASVFSVFGQAFGIEAAANWTFGPSLALVVIILYNIWVFVGYNTVIFLAGLGNIPHVLYEAAEIDGAGRWALFRHVTLPLLSPITFLLSVMAVIGTFKAFTHIWVLRQTAALGTTDTASIYFFEQFFRGARFGYATSMAIVLFVIILALTLLQNRLAERRVFYG
jgi:multiple sugar transport system permease protein